MSDDDTFRWGDEDYEFAEEFFMPDSPSDEEYEMEKSEAEPKDQSEE